MLQHENLISGNDNEKLISGAVDSNNDNYAWLKNKWENKQNIMTVIEQIYNQLNTQTQISWGKYRLTTDLYRPMMNKNYNIQDQEVILFKALLLASEKLDIPDCEDYLFKIISKKENVSIDDVRAYEELLIKMFSLYFPNEAQQAENIEKYGGKLKKLLEKCSSSESIEHNNQKEDFFQEFKNKAKNLYQDGGFRNEQYKKITSENKEIMNKMMEQRKQEFGTSWEKSPLWWKIVSVIFTFGIRPLCNLKAPLCCCCEDSVRVME